MTGKLLAEVYLQHPEALFFFLLNSQDSLPLPEIIFETGNIQDKI
jgi:hypothetical protein